MRFPKPLRLGDEVAVVAPASPFDRDEFLCGLAWLHGRYKLRVSSDILARQGYLAGDDERRARELRSAMLDPRVTAIIAARGGYGTMRIVDHLPWDEFARSPKWLVGFSDVTALHLRAQSLGIASVHGPHVTGLGRWAHAWGRARLLEALETPHLPVSWTDLRTVHSGPSASGVAVGGNLAMVDAMAASGAFVVPEQAILFLEDVTERPYRIDRMLTALRNAGHLQRASAIVFGGFTRCDPGPDGVTVDQVLEERTSGLGIPVVAGAPFGHEPRNDAFVLGSHASLRDGVVTFCMTAD